jgi:hypothetical protein
MQSEQWARLFGRVPPEQHDQLMVMTVGGTEIAVQTLLRVETEFVALKGRIAGSQTAGRLFFIPFASIDYFGFQRDVKDAEFHAMYGSGPLAVTAPAVECRADPAAAPAGAPEETPASVAGSTKTPLPIKSEVLERFRSRLSGQPASAPPRRVDG